MLGRIAHTKFFPSEESMGLYDVLTCHQCGWEVKCPQGQLTEMIQEYGVKE